MTADDFKQMTHAAGIRSDAYDLDGRGDRNECHVVTQVDGAWVVFYGERGLETGIRRFATQSEALVHLLATLRADTTTRW